MTSHQRLESTQMHNPNNERIKHEYLRFLKEAKRKNEATLDKVAKAVARFEVSTGHRDFKKFHVEQAIAFKRTLADHDSQTTGEKLSQATQYATLMHLKAFFQWLATQPGYRSRIQYGDGEYFNFPDKETRIAKARRPTASPSLADVTKLIKSMP